MSEYSMPSANLRTLHDDTLIVFLSDTHIGGDAGQEVFESPLELAALLDDLAAQSGSVELVLAGDFFDFLRTHTHAAIDVMVELGGRLRENDRIFRSMVSRNVNEMEEEQLTLGQRIADRVADTIGSWPFIIIQSILLVVWIVLNITAWIKGWDPYPFILLNLMLSFQAAYAGPVIMMSQNRQSSKDRLAAEIDHQVNTKAELEINNLMRRMDELELSVEENHTELKQLLGIEQKRKSTNSKRKLVK